MRRLNLTVAAGVVAALIGGGLVWAYGRGIEGRIAEGRATVPVLVADARLEAGSSSAELKDMVATQQIPRAFVAEGAISSLDGVAGMSLAGPIPAGIQLTRESFVVPRDLTVLKPSRDHVALAVGVAISPGVARYLEPGSTVDVLATYRSVSTPDEARGGLQGRASNRTKLFVSGVKVLSVRIAPASAPEEEMGSTPVGEDIIVLLDVTPLDAEKIVNAVTLGEIYLAMSDGSKHTTRAGATPEDVVGGSS